MNKEKYIPLLPLPQGKTFITNELSVTGLKESGLYQPNGKYFIKSSSERSDKHKAFNAFNVNTNTYWECDNVSNPDYNVLNTSYAEYKQSPYNTGNPSAYRGGGNKSNYWTTKVGTRQIEVPGEWIQVQLPYKIYLTSYLLVTPAFIKDNIFPVNFMIAGSLDGESWDLVNQHQLKGTELPETVPEKMFYLSPTKQYNFFRFIVMKMTNNIGTVKISNLKLFGSTQQFSNASVSTNKETFVNLNRGLSNKEKIMNNELVKPHTNNIFSNMYANLFPSKEGIENEYKTKNEYSIDYDDAECNKEKAKLVIDNQITPITKTAKKQEKDMTHIIKNYNQLDDSLNKHYKIWNEMSEDRKYNFNSEYDLNAKIKNKDEVRKEDVRKMADLSSQTLFLGGLASFTLLVGVIMIKNSD